MSVGGSRSRTSSTVTLDDHLKAPIGAIRKVPGEVAPVGRLDHEAKAFERDIKAKSVPQLQEVLERQNKILENSALLKKLPDKGAKVKQRKEMIENLIETRMRSLNEAADLLAALTIGNGSPKKGERIDCDEMEWKFGGGHLFRKLAPPTEELDSDDDSDDAETDSTNPLKLLAARELPTAKKEKAVTTKKESDSVVDSGNSESPRCASAAEKGDSVCEVGYAEHLSSKADDTKTKTRFIPYKSVGIKSDMSKKSDPIGSLRHTPKTDRPIKNRQIEVMPLPSENYARVSVKMVSLKDSLELERQQGERLKEIQLKHAMERLGAVAGTFKMKEADLTAEERMAYRDRVEGSDFNVDEDEEAHDEDYNASDGLTINFTQTELEDP